MRPKSPPRGWLKRHSRQTEEVVAPAPLFESERFADRRARSAFQSGTKLARAPWLTFRVIRMSSSSVSAPSGRVIDARQKASNIMADADHSTWAAKPSCSQPADPQLLDQAGVVGMLPRQNLHQLSLLRYEGDQPAAAKARKMAFVLGDEIVVESFEGEEVGVSEQRHLVCGDARLGRSAELRRKTRGQRWRRLARRHRSQERADFSAFFTLRRAHWKSFRPPAARAWPARASAG